jgi:DNA-binding XRE family transcriptional regulator
MVYCYMVDDEFDRVMAELRAWARQAEFGEQKKLAEQLGVAPQKLNHWITGKKTPNVRDGFKLQAFVNKLKRRRFH